MIRPVTGEARPRHRADALTSDEKLLLLQGTAFWNTNSIPRLGIPSLYVTDGPHGVRKARAAAGAFGVADNEPATAFPPAATLANTWNPPLARSVGAAIAREARNRGVHVVLAPGVNIKRNPLCGRNFEYYSEDPLISGVFGEAFVEGVQSEGVAASVKHFAANSSEDFRFVGNSLVDERALREIYLRQFERIVRRARPATVMCAYNAINGVFSSDNRLLLTGILLDEWGVDGVVLTGWGATHDRVESLLAGCDLDMPGDNEHNRAAIADAIRDGRVPPSAVDEAVTRILSLIERFGPRDDDAPVHDEGSHADLARSVATEGAVLLQNDGTLPLDPSAPGLVVIGEMFERMRFQGAGSSLVTPTDVIAPQAAFDARGVPYRYARGYRSMYDAPDPVLEQEAVEAARAGGTVLFFGGLTDREESEGFDRRTMALGAGQVRLLTQILDTGATVVLVLFAGAPVELPFARRLAAILDLYLPGMHGGPAAASLLFGDVSPSGKLSESWPRSASESSSAADYNRGPQATYYESIYVGYRYHDAATTELQFSFGHGLSYTRFEYRDLRMLDRDGRIHISATILNTGERDAAEVVQVYVRNNHSAVFKAEKELRAFEKVWVPAGSAVDVELQFDLEDLAYWDVTDKTWRLETGDYEVLLAASASDVRLRAPLRVAGAAPSRSPYPRSVDTDYATPPSVIPSSFPELLGHPVPQVSASRRLTLETRLIDARRTIVGALMYGAVLRRARQDYRAALALPDGVERDAAVKNTHFLVRMMPFNTLRSMAMSSTGALPYRVAAGIAELAAFRPLRAIHWFRRPPSTDRRR